MKREDVLELLRQGSITKDEFLILTESKSTTTSILSKDNDNKSSILHIVWEGMWMLIDAKVKIYIDNEFKFEGSFKDGFDYPMLISKECYDIEIKLGSMKTTKFKVNELLSSKNYCINLQYNSIWGKFSKDIKIIDL